MDDQTDPADTEPEPTDPDYLPPPITGENLMAVTGVRGVLERDPKRITVSDKDRAEMLPRDIRRAVRRWLEAATEPFQRSGKVEPFDYNWALNALSEAQQPQHLIDLAGAFRPEDGDIATDYIQVARRVFEYLQGILPIRTEETMATTFNFDPSDSEIAGFRRAFDVANDPMIILRDMGRGCLVADQIRHLTALYPAIYAQIKLQMATGMADALARKQSWKPSYARDRQVQVLYGTTTWNKALAADIQKNFATDAKKQPSGPNPAQSTSKAASTLQTPTQAVVDGSKA